MFHLFHGTIHTQYSDTQVLLDNSLFGILTIYTWIKSIWEKGSRYIHPRIDQKSGAVSYFAFDTREQKHQFLELLKIQWVWGKSAYLLSMLPREEVYAALDAFDIWYFTAHPGIWPKTAKRILIDLKKDMQQDEMQKLGLDEKLLKDILTSLHDLWYKRTDVKALLPDCPHPLTRDDLPDVMKWLVEQLASV